MSILDSEKGGNPTKFYEWSSSEGKLKTYNKNTKTNQFIDILKFVVTDQASCIKGWCDEASSGYWSNEFRSSSDTITLKTSKGVVAKDVYAEIKKIPGVKYAKVVYGYDTQTKEAIGICFYGASVGVAIEAKIKDGCKYEVSTNPEKQKKGANRYWIPSINKVDLAEGELEEAINIYKNVVKPYKDQRSLEQDNDKKIEEVSLESLDEIHLRGLEDIKMPF